ncbi:hypothetical protein D9613_008844 [Agrocybe pediades]|uniref:Uncharacterized protein n=1 Tax=Agrocybe pediades TaxID=84607 RepID=A0A8H4VNE1_9AGAR|nr:hypothetical protein D9613_008844 [Agrocybe pediades]
MLLSLVESTSSPSLWTSMTSTSRSNSVVSAAATSRLSPEDGANPSSLDMKLSDVSLGLAVPSPSSRSETTVQVCSCGKYREDAAPSMCGGLTVYSLLIRNEAGLSYMAIQFAKALGCDEIVAFSHLNSKEKDAMALDAINFVATREERFQKPFLSFLDFIIVYRNFASWCDACPLRLLCLWASFVMIALPDDKLPSLEGSSLLSRAFFGGSLLGSKKDWRVKPWIEVMPTSYLVSDVSKYGSICKLERSTKQLGADLKHKHTMDLQVLLQDTKPQSNLPVELHERIINELDGEEDALKQCALTCKLYRHLAQTLLFKAVMLQFQPESNPAKKFLAILTQSPHVANYVGCLSLRGYDDRWYDKEWTESKKPDDDGIADVLSALTNLQELQLFKVCSGRNRRTFQALSLSPASMAMIQFKCRSILHLTLQKLDNMPLTMLAHSSSLESLDIDNVELVDDLDDQAGPETIDSQTSFPHLKLMRISNATTLGYSQQSIYPFLMRSTTQGGLESLSVNMDESWDDLLVPAVDFQAVKEIIRNSATSLKAVDVIVPLAKMPILLDNDEPLFNVSEMPLLEELSLTGTIHCNESDEDRTHIDLHWLSRHLETFPNDGRKFNKISLHLIITNAFCLKEDQLDDEGLKYFEDLLLNVVSHQRLSLSVKFTIRGRIFDEHGAETLIRQHLHGLEAENLLEFDTTDVQGESELFRKNH